MHSDCKRSKCVTISAGDCDRPERRMGCHTSSGAHSGSKELAAVLLLQPSHNDVQRIRN